MVPDHQEIVQDVLTKIEDELGLEPVRTLREGENSELANVTVYESEFYFPESMEFTEFESAMMDINFLGQDPCISNDGYAETSALPMHRDRGSEGENRLSLSIITYHQPGNIEASQ